MQLEIDTEVSIEEKRLEEEEKRLQSLKEELLRQKQHQHDELSRIRDNRRRKIAEFNEEITKQNHEWVKMRETLAREQRVAEDLEVQSKDKMKMAELELEQRETQVNNLDKRLRAEKRSFEEEPKE